VVMPRKPLSPCSYPGCPKLCEGRYCEEHKKLTDRQYNRYERSADVNKIYGRSWKRIRDKYAREHPLCERCLREGRATIMQQVHHIVPVSQGGTNDPSNLMSLCQSCHTKMHIELGDRKIRR